MTTFERDYKELTTERFPDTYGIMSKRQNEIERLKKELKCCRNGFRAQCIIQELEKRQSEYRILDSLI